MTLLLVLLLQTSVLLALGLGALWAVRRRGPAVQTLAGRAALSGVALLLLLLPLSGRIAPMWRLPVGPPAPILGSRSSDKNTRALPILPSAVPSPLASAAPAIPSDARPAALGAASSAPTPSPSSAPNLSFRENPAPEARAAEAVGLLSGVLLLWLAACRLQLTRLRRAATRITDGPAAALLASLTPRPPALLTHPSVQSPFLAGVRRPAIFLPPSFEADFAPDALRAVFLHELAHLGRRDTLWTLAARVLTALLWFQPLLWLLCRKLEHISEDACDQAVLAANCSPRAYAASLLALAERPPLRASHRPLSAAVAPYRSSVGRRISRILTLGGQSMSPVTLRLRLTIAALTLAAVTGGAFLVSSAPAKTQSPSVVGVWLRPLSDGGNIVMSLRPDGRYEDISLRGDKLFHQYGRYRVHGGKLTYILTKCWQEGDKPFPCGPETHDMDYALSGDTLTVGKKGQYETINRRSSYSQAMLRLKQSALASRTAELRQLTYELSKYLGKTPAQASNSGALGQAQFLAGLTPVQGPGVIVTLTDSKEPLTPKMPPGMTPPNLIHDTDINQVVNELKAAGAEAVAVNRQRLVATSAVRSAGARVFINNTPQAGPYIVKAIGSPRTLLSALNRPGGIASQIRQYDPAMFSARHAATLTLPAYTGNGQMRFARPVTADNAIHRPE